MPRNVRCGKTGSQSLSVRKSPQQQASLPEADLEMTSVWSPAASARGRPLSRRFMLITAAISMIVAAAALALTIRSTNGFAVWSDGVAYFLFARSAVIDRDLDITNEFDYLDQRFARDSKAIEPLRKWSTRRADGKIQPAWPVGAGVVMAPFYALGYAVESATAKVAGRPADSYGVIPQVAFALGSVLFGVIGLWCLALTCREIANDEVAYIASLGVVLCGPVVF